jgi:hypothetical protein
MRACLHVFLGEPHAAKPSKSQFLVESPGEFVILVDVVCYSSARLELVGQGEVPHMDCQLRVVEYGKNEAPE